MENDNSNKAPLNLEGSDSLTPELRGSAVNKAPLSLEGSERNLLSLGKWTKFFAVLNYIAIGFIILGIIGALFGAVSNPYMGGEIIVMVLIYVIVLILMIIPTNFLNRAGNGLRRAVQTGDNKSLADGIEGLKSYYAFHGILTVIALCIYALLIVLTILGGIASAF